jgi:hypothetical protein
MTTEKQLKKQVTAAFFSNPYAAERELVRVTPDNIDAARLIIRRRGHTGAGFDCRRWGHCEALGYAVYHCGITDPQVGDILVAQCGSVG